jgi:hypothetical protein
MDAGSGWEGEEVPHCSVPELVIRTGAGVSMGSLLPEGRIAHLMGLPRRK